ncbi:MAG: alpha/beta hydrolase [Verrucomicrobia bacterium]|nr:alpha/beta hydrolase [Verrucomicrobiota bacterium]
MKPSLHILLRSRIAIALILPAFLTSCATAPHDVRNSPLDQAAALQKSAGSPSRDPERFVVSQLRAAQIASSQPASSARAKAISEASTAAIASWAVVSDRSGGSRQFSYQGITYDLSLPGGPGTIPASSFASLKPASEVHHALVKDWQARPGVGAPVAAKWNPPANKAQAKFAPPTGYIAPVTAWLEFSGKTGGKVRLKFLDPTVVKSVRSDGKTLPLAADFSAPLVDQTRNVRELLLALEGLIDPEVHDASLGMLQPYDPEKIPVVFIHGLMSHPRMWRDVINDLMADPDISARYQFWVYYYPTGWPIAYSAMRLREDLAAVDKALGRQKDIVLVGHSMGGLLARMQAISPGDTLMHALLPQSRWEQFKKTPATHIARKSIEFHANPDVERIIFISTPHRGSGMADWSLTTWFTKFIHLPSKLTSAAVDLIPTLLTNPEHYTSISRLSPTNPLYKALEKIPIRAPHHSIIGDRGRGDTPNSSDGVVPYWSSHLDSAESEVIVPDDHGSFDAPAAIAEIKRILEKNHARR